MRKKVLIVDDSMDMLTFVRTLVKTSSPYMIYIAKNGDEGMKKIKKVEPDLILLDVMMPIVGGLEMYRELKTNEEYKNIPVVFLSAVSEKTFRHSQETLDRYHGEVPSPQEYIEKPVEPDELLEAIRRNI